MIGKARKQAGSIECKKFLDPRIVRLEPVGSRELEGQKQILAGQGRKTIGVYGYPVAKLPLHVCRAAEEAISAIQFPASNGLLELRQALAQAIKTQYRTSVDVDTEILVTNGAMHALHVAFTSLLAPKDEVLLISPCYFFGGLVKITGARQVCVPMSEKHGFAMDFDRIRRNITPQTKIIVLSSPVNPTGYVYTREDVEQFIGLAEENDLLLISDESYDRLIYDGREHLSPFHYPEGRRRTILVKSFTKSYALPMWRVGYLAANAELTKYFRKVLEWTVLHCAYANQRVALAALEGPQDWLLAIFSAFEARRNQLLRGLSAISAFSYVTPAGGPYIFLNVSRLTNDCDLFGQYLLHRYGIPAVPGKYFNSREHVRIPFGGSEDSVRRLVTALGQAASETKNF